jgi:hypothetical protein
MSYLEIRNDGSGNFDIRGDEKGLRALRNMVDNALANGSYFVEGGGQEVLVVKVKDADPDYLPGTMDGSP